MHYLSPERVQMNYDLPLAEIVLDFFDQLKSRTRGYASLDYELSGMKPSDLVKLDVLLAGDPVDALSMVVHREKAYEIGRTLTEKLRKRIPRQQYDVPIQAAIGAHVIARETVKAFRKDVIARLLRRRHHAQEKAARETEGGQETDEAGRPRGGAPGGVPGGARARRGVARRRDDAPAVRLPRQHLPLADGRGRDAPRSSTRGAARRRSSSTRPARARWHVGSAPDRRARAPRAGAGVTLAGRARQVLPEDFERLRPDPRDGQREPARPARRSRATRRSATKVRLLREFDPASAPAAAISTSPTPTTAPAMASRRCFDLVEAACEGLLGGDPRGPRAVTLPPGARRRAARRRRRHQRGVPGAPRRRAARRSSRRRADAAPGEYEAEAAGLRWLAEPGRCARRRCSRWTSDYLALEWVEPGASERRRARRSSGGRSRARTWRGADAVRRAAGTPARQRASARCACPTSRRRTGRPSTPSGACCRWRELARERGAAERAGRRARSSACASGWRAVRTARAALAAARRPVGRAT